MTNLTPKQQRRLKRVKEVLAMGDLAIAKMIIELEDKLDEDIPQIKNIIAKVKGDKGDKGETGDNYILTKDDKKEIFEEVKKLYNEDSIVAKIDKKEIAKLVKLPKPKNVYIENPFIPDGFLKAEDLEELRNNISNIEQLSVEDFRNGLETFQGEDRLKFSAISGSEDLLEDIKKLKERPIFNGRGGGGGAGMNRIAEDGDVKYTGQGILNYGSGFDVTVDGNVVNVDIDLDEIEAQAFTLQEVTDNGATTTNSLTALSFIKSGGVSTEFLKADGSVDSSTYLTTGTASSTYVPYTGATGNVDLGANDIIADAGDIANELAVGTTSGKVIIGDITGNARGAGAIDIQSDRSGVTAVASGSNSSAFGYDNTASGSSSSAFGYDNIASQYRASAFGARNTASGTSSSASGYNNTASGTYSSAFGYDNIASQYRASAFGARNTVSGFISTASGYNNTVSGNNSSVLGSSINNSTDNSVEIGPSNTSKFAIRSNGNAISSGDIQATNKMYSGTTTLSVVGPTDNLNVANANTVFIDTSANNVTIGGLVGGVSGQELNVVIVNATNNTTLEHNEGTANQNIFLESGADETKTASFGGWTLVCNGTSWFQVK